MTKSLTLAERLKQQTLDDSATIRDQTQEQLRAMRKELTGTWQRELNTMKADIQSESRGLGWSMLRNRFLWPFLVGLSLCIGLFGGSWGIMQYYSDRISEAQHTVQALEERGGRAYLRQCGDPSRLCIEIDPSAPEYGKNGQFRIIQGY